MTENKIQDQIDVINKKLDIVLEEIYVQKSARESTSDLLDDLSIVGKDVFENTVIELDKAGVEIDSAALQGLGIRMIRNIHTLNQLLETLESVNDFLQDATPIFHQIGLDAIHKVSEFDKKGYIDFFKEMGHVFDNIVTHFSKDDIRELADNVVTILDTIKRMTQPDMLLAMNNAITVYKNLETKNIPEYSIWKVVKELKTPEMKRGLGFMISFLKNLSKEETQNKQLQ